MLSFPRMAALEELERRWRPALFKALGDATRIKVVARLVSAGHPLSVTEVADCCGVHLSGVSRHLALLREAGVVSLRRRGREALYSIDRHALASLLRGLAEAIEGFYAREDSR